MTRIVLLTGATSGIGRVAARKLAERGLTVLFTGRDREAGREVLSEIRRVHPESDGEFYRVDFADFDAVRELAREVRADYDRLDALVNNAGASFMANFEDISPNGWQKILDINLGGTYNCTQAAEEYLKDGGGSVVNVASVAGQRGAPYMSHYGAAKAAVVNLTSTLAFEWASDGVRVNCIAPGFVATPGLASQMGISADEVDREAVERRVGTSEEIADVARFLASDASSFVVGETITAGGVPDVLESPDV